MIRLSENQLNKSWINKNHMRRCIACLTFYQGLDPSGKSVCMTRRSKAPRVQVDMRRNTAYVPPSCGNPFVFGCVLKTCECLG